MCSYCEANDLGSLLENSSNSFTYIYEIAAFSLLGILRSLMIV